MNMGEVVDSLKMGLFLRRATWPNITYIYLDGDIIMYSHLGIDSVWTPNHQDLLNDDWETTMPTR